MKEDLIVGFFAGLLLVLFVAAMAMAIGFMSTWQCSSQWPDHNPSWAWVQGCMIDTDAGRIPAKNYRAL